MFAGFAKGDILQVLLFAILFGFALMAMGERGKPLRTFIDDMATGTFGVIGIVMKVAPIGAFGAMAFTIGKFGPQALGNLLGLIATFYLTSAIFVIVVLGIIARIVGFNIFRFLAYIKDELLVVMGTSNITGNGVATIFVSWWEGELDREKLKVLTRQPAPTFDEAPALAAE